MSTGGFPARFPHSDICGSMCICHSPQLFAAYHVFLRLLVPRHPPCALIRFTSIDIALSIGCVFVLFVVFTTFSLVCSRMSLSFCSNELAISCSLVIAKIFFLLFCIKFSMCIMRLALASRDGLKWTRTTDLTLIRRAL